MPPFIEDIEDLISDDGSYDCDGFYHTSSSSLKTAPRSGTDSRSSSSLEATPREETSQLTRRSTRWSSTPATDLDLSSDSEVTTDMSTLPALCKSTKIHASEPNFFESHFHRRRGQANDSDWVMVELDDFFVYRNNDGQTQRVSLHEVSLNLHKREASIYYFDGNAAHDDGCTFHVKGLRVLSLSIGNIDGADESLKPLHVTCDDEIYLETVLTEKYNGYYRLRSAHDDYTMMYKEFTWLANLFKYVIDYLEYSADMGKTIGLESFKTDFLERLLFWHHDQELFKAWHRRCGNIKDFRRHVACASSAAFLQGRADGLQDDSIASHDLWSDIGRPLEPVKSSPLTTQTTLTTTFVADCFLKVFPAWKHILEVCELAPQLRQWNGNKKEQLGLSGKATYSQDDFFETHDHRLYSKVSLLLQKAGQTLPQQRFTSGADLVERAIIARNHKEDCYSRVCNCPVQFAYVLRYSKGQGLYVRWMVVPLQTICSGLRGPQNAANPPHYPIGNELFFVDDCTCATVHLSDVLASYTIAVGDDHAAMGYELFVHREYSELRKTISDLTSWNSPLCPQHRRIDMRDFEKAGPFTTSIKGEAQPGEMLSIFSGCGLMDAGIEHGSEGAFQPIFTADINYEAYCSLKANFRHHSSCQFHHENVNVLLQKLVDGRLEPKGIALFLAGCPCQGFSRLNADKSNREAQRNCSLLAHTLSWIEVLLPRMVVIENVLDMDSAGANARTPSAAGQAVCFLVSLGYQVKLVRLKDSNYGGATIRERIFIVATVPGIDLPNIPKPTHGDENPPEAGINRIQRYSRS